MTKTSVSLNLLRFNSESDENIFASYKFSKGWRRTTKENWVTFFSCSSRFFFSLFSAGGSDDAAVGVDDDDLDAAVEVDVDDDDVAVVKSLVVPVPVVHDVDGVDEEGGQDERLDVELGLGGHSGEELEQSEAL